MNARLNVVMRKGLILAVLVAIVTMPMAYAGVGFCRSMPCCAPSLTEQITAAQQPDCCNTTNCGRAPDAVSEYTAVKQLQKHQLVLTSLIPTLILPSTQTVAKPAPLQVCSPPLLPPALQRRIAILSTFLV